MYILKTIIARTGKEIYALERRNKFMRIFSPREKPLAIFCFFIFVFIFASNLFPQSIKSIQVNDANIFSNNDIIDWGEITVGSKIFPGIIDSVKSRIALQLGNRGYLHSIFNGTALEYSADSQSVILVIALKEGEPTYVNQIITSGLDSSLSAKILPMFEYLRKQIFNKFELENDISLALTYYENNGYPFAKIIIPSIYFYRDSTKDNFLADIYLNFDKDIYCKIDKIKIFGNTSTQDFVIQRELRIKKGEEYSQQLIDELPKRLNRLGYFEPVNKPEFFLDSKNEGILKITVKEKETNNFDGIIGYIPSTTNNQGGYLTGLINVSLRNLFGTGRAAAIRWQQYDKYSQDLELKYLEPWLFNYPFNFTASLYQRKQDSSYVQRTLEGNLEYLATDNFSASIFVSSEVVIPTELTNQTFTVFNSSSITTGVNIKIDTRDDPYSPTQGFLFNNSYAFSKKTIIGPGQFITPGTATNVNLQRFTVDLDGYYNLFQRQVVALGVHGRELRGSNFEVSDLYRLGGANSLRGYMEDQFLGNRILWTNLEYRLLLTRRTFGFLFFDTGYFLQNANPEMKILKNEGFRIGYGLGLNIETGLGVLRVSFALAKGDTFAHGKIHFGLVNEF